MSNPLWQGVVLWCLPTRVGAVEGSSEGSRVGASDGPTVGRADGTRDGRRVGTWGGRRGGKGFRAGQNEGWCRGKGDGEEGDEHTERKGLDIMLGEVAMVTRAPLHKSLADKARQLPRARTDLGRRAGGLRRGHGRGAVAGRQGGRP
jgi:hypothetical protein